MGWCSKTLKFVITIITWWVGVIKKWNCPLLFVTNLWCSHFFLQKVNFSTSQTRKKSCLVFTTNACFFWTIVKQKKCFIVLHNKIVVLTRRKKNFWLCLFVFCFLHFGYLEEKTTLKKTKKTRLFSSKGKCSLFCFWQ